MDQSSIDRLPKGWKSIPSDLGSDQTTFKGVNWGKAMMSPAFKNIKVKIKVHLNKP